MVLITGVLIWAYQHYTEELLVDHESRSNADLTRALANTVWGDYREFVARSGALPRESLASDPAVAQLRADVLTKMGGLRVVKVKVYNLQGTTVFSTDPRQIGEDKSANAGFRSARDGVVASDITYRDRFDAFEGTISGRNLIYSYIPVRPRPDAPVEGVFEVYSDVTELVAEQNEARAQIAAILLAALVCLYLFMLFIVRKAHRIIEQQQRERAAQEEAIRHQAHHDALTGLPNRVYFAERLSEVLAASQGSRPGGALLFIDLDRFKVVNDSIGHAGGDTLLKAVAERIRRALRMGDLVFRMGGDEFTAILPTIEGPDCAASAARRIISGLSTPFKIYGHEVCIGASVGIAVFPADGSSVDALVRNADAAMYSRKQTERGSYAFYQASMNERAAQRLGVEAALTRAFERGEFELHYQPRVHTLSGRVVSVEALLRWNHPSRGLLLPDEFLAVLEDMDLMTLVGEWVLQSACRQLAQWRAEGLQTLHVSVNVSPRQFQQVGFAEMVSRVLADTGLPPAHLELELTESLLIADAEGAGRILAALEACGVHVAIDDFGTGFSSLDRLRRLPVQTLKIDRGMVADLPGSERDRAIVAAIGALGRALGITVVAEGVETHAQANFLRGTACGELQGYLFSRPVPADRIPAFCASAGTPVEVAVSSSRLEAENLVQGVFSPVN
ncbi:MAG: putative bifunctional diguanylate cyclase/phosphodiesterase [Rubrivivax sp.]